MAQSYLFKSNAYLSLDYNDKIEKKIYTIVIPALALPEIEKLRAGGFIVVEI